MPLIGPVGTRVALRTTPPSAPHVTITATVPLHTAYHCTLQPTPQRKAATKGPKSCCPRNVYHLARALAFCTGIAAAHCTPQAFTNRIAAHTTIVITPHWHPRCGSLHCTQCCLSAPAVLPVAQHASPPLWHTTADYTMPFVVPLGRRTAVNTTPLIQPSPYAHALLLVVCHTSSSPAPALMPHHATHHPLDTHAVRTASRPLKHPPCCPPYTMPV
jgi:hypothetical protein